VGTVAACRLPGGSIRRRLSLSRAQRGKI